MGAADPAISGSPLWELTVGASIMLLIGFSILSFMSSFMMSLVLVFALTVTNIWLKKGLSLVKDIRESGKERVT